MKEKWQTVIKVLCETLLMRTADTNIMEWWYLWWAMSIRLSSWCMRTGYTFTAKKCLFLRLKPRCFGWFLAHIKSSWSVITDTGKRQVTVLLRVKWWDGEPVMQPQVTEHHIMLPKCSQAPRKQIIIVIWHTVTERLSESHPANKWQSDD